MAVVSLLSASIFLLAGLASGGETGLAVSGRADSGATPRPRHEHNANVALSALTSVPSSLPP